MDGDLIRQLQVFSVELAGVLLEACPLDLIADRGRCKLHQRDAMQQCRQGLQRCVEGQAARLHAVRRCQHRRQVAGRKRVEHRMEMIVAHRAQHVRDLLLLDLARAVRDRLVEQRQRIAHGAGRGLGQMAQRARLEGHLLRLQDAGQVVDDMPLRHLLEVELQAARQHRDGNLLRIGGGEDELDMLGRLLERLQHGVEGMPGEHVHFVDHVHLVAPLHRRIHGLVEQRRHVLHAAVGGSVHLDIIGEAVGIDGATRFALATRLRCDARLAVERLGQDAADGGLADAARPGEQPGVVQAPGGEGVRERAHDVLLTDQRAEGLRTPFARKDLIAHGGRF